MQNSVPECRDSNPILSPAGSRNSPKEAKVRSGRSWAQAVGMAERARNRHASSRVLSRLENVRITAGCSDSGAVGSTMCQWLPFAVTGDDRQWRSITSCFWPLGMLACHAGYCTTRPPSTRQCASSHRSFLCSQRFQRSKCSALCVKGASAGDGARGSLRPAGPFVWSKVRRSLRAREPARHRATLP